MSRFKDTGMIKICSLFFSPPSEIGESAVNAQSPDN